MTATLFHVEADMAGIIEVPAAGTLSRTVLDADGVRVVVFGFAEGEELTEHTSTRPALIQVLRGSLTVTLAGEPFDAPAGAWIHMTAGLHHAVRARTAAVMLLTLLPTIGATPGQ